MAEITLRLDMGDPLALVDWVVAETADWPDAMRAPLADQLTAALDGAGGLAMTFEGGAAVATLGAPVFRVLRKFGLVVPTFAEIERGA